MCLSTALPLSKNSFFGGEEVATLYLGWMPVVQHPCPWRQGLLEVSGCLAHTYCSFNLLHLYVLLSHDKHLLPEAIFLLPVLVLKPGKNQLAFLIKIRKPQKQLCLKKLFSPAFTWLGTNSLILLPPETSPSEYVYQSHHGRSPIKYTSAGSQLPRNSSLGLPGLHVLSPPKEWSAIPRLLSTGLQPRPPEVPGTTHFSPNCLYSCLQFTESTMFLMFLMHFRNLVKSRKRHKKDSWSRPEHGVG